MSIFLVVLTSLLLFRSIFLVDALPSGANGGRLHERAPCNIQTSSSVSCNNGIVTFGTSQGSISGLLTSNAIRFTVKYATAARFQPPQITSLTSSFPNATALPPMCPQTGVDPSNYSEDCLYFVAYVPTNVTPVTYSGGAPVLVWIHGGSYISGSASDPYLNGSKLASATGSVVVVLQYRLGILGYLPPQSFSQNKNLGVQDVITALKWIQNVVGLLGGDKAKVTLAGQSSGANLIRNLLGTPSASNLFSRAISQSDPISYGFLSPTTFTNLQTAFYSGLNCGSCTSTPLSTLLAAQGNFNAQAVDPAAGMGEPIRPVLDGTLIQYSLTKTFPPNLKNLLLTTVKDEAGPAIYGNVPYPLPPAYYYAVATPLFGSPRDANVSAEYRVAQRAEGEDIRPLLVQAGTDSGWRCPAYTLARKWATNNGNVWVGEFRLGSTYPSNAGIAYCTTPGNVCHEDDIPIVFGTTTSPSAAQIALTAQIQARWGAFVKYGNPNTNGYPNWPQLSRDGTVPVQNLGGSGPIPLGSCDPSVWGSSILYDYQIYNQ
ncbi:hypothetical protein FRC17_008253 [Serendipita sp. 399]|nr:hypothetical protein FRC17_008253 [Serendipita sp. 399]